MTDYLTTAATVAVLAAMAAGTAHVMVTPDRGCDYVRLWAGRQLDDYSWRTRMLAAAAAAEEDAAAAVWMTMRRAWPHATAARARQPFPPGRGPATVWPIQVPNVVPPTWVPLPAAVAA